MITPEQLVFAKGWNELLRLRRRNRIVGMQSWTRRRVTHPWRTFAAWNTERRQFEAVVRPGLVNARAPLTADEEKLTDAPSIPLTTWRKPGTGTGLGGFDPVPEFFQALGVASATLNDEESPLPPRQLRAMDIVLHHQRPSLTTALIAGALRVGVKGSSLPRARIRATAKIAAPLADPDPLQQLAGNWSDGDEDAQLVSTVYVLSPENAAEDAPVDETWQAFAKHELFWNLAYAHSDLPNLDNPNAITVPAAGLAGGAGDAQIGGITAEQNTAFAHAVDFITTRRIVGRFWSV